MNHTTLRLIVHIGMFLGVGATLFATEPAEGDSAQKFINSVEHEWYRRKAGNIEEWYPFGHTNKAHGVLLKQRGPAAPVSKDWSITNKSYLSEDNWYAVEWLYRATDLATGKKQIEATLGFAQIKDQKIVLWMEFFDDTVGEQQIKGTLPLYADADEPFPWPETKTFPHPYRP